MINKNQTITLKSPVLKWARSTLYGRDFAEPASKLGIPLDQLRQWEIDDPTVTVSQLKKISKVYKRHISVILLPIAPRSLEPPKFRRLPDFIELSFDKATFLAIRQAQEIQNTTTFLLEEKPNEFLSVLQKDVSDENLLAKKVIEMLNIDENLRFKSKTAKEQLTVWKHLLESRGVLILELKFPLKDSRAFTIYDKVSPVIVLNSSDTDNARIFSIFHELGHLVLGQTELDDVLDLGSRTLHKNEVFCNYFSASVLVPNQLFKNVLGRNTILNDDRVRELSHKFKVSMAVVWIKLKEMGLLSPEQLAKVKPRLSVFEPFLEEKNKKKSGGGNADTYLYSTLKRKSEYFVSEVFEAFNNNRITYFEVLDYIGVKSESLPRLQKLMFR